jgi:hypothetical protein
MSTAVAMTGAGFLLAVLWFDLMFDVQVRGHDGAVLPTQILDSIAAYYRRVTTEARPMNRLVSLAMLVTLVSIAIEIAQGAGPLWLSAVSLIFLLGAIGLALARTFRNAATLGRGTGTPEFRSRLARLIYKDHLSCLAAIAVVIGLQLAGAWYGHSS